MGTLARRTGSAAVADASAQAGEDACAGQEPVAAHRHEPGNPQEAKLVERGGAPDSARSEAGSVDGTAPRRSAGSAGPSRGPLSEAGPGGGTSGPGQCRCPAADAASRNWSGDQFGLRAYPGGRQPVREQSPGGQLSGIESGRVLQRRASTFRTDQQTGQCVHAQTAVRGDEALARQYRRLAAKKNRATAKVMVARKLAVRMFWILKTKAQYPEVVRMQGSSSHSVVNITDRLCERPASQQS